VEIELIGDRFEIYFDRWRRPSPPQQPLATGNPDAGQGDT
jgi:hypothetical protein